MSWLIDRSVSGPSSMHGSIARPRRRHAAILTGMGPRNGVAAALERTVGRRQTRRIRGQLMGRTHLLPDFIIIGAARSGTTHLLGQLNAHPNVLAGPRETHFFDSHRYTLRAVVVPPALPGPTRPGGRPTPRGCTLS